MHMKIRRLKKPIYKEELPKKWGLGHFTDLRGKRGGVGVGGGGT